MAKRAIEHIFTGATTPYTTYDSTKTVLGDLIEQYTGSLATDKFAGPAKMGVGRPNEVSTASPGIYPHVITWADKNGFYNTGTVAVTGTDVAGNGTSWLTGGVPIGARIGFNSSNNASITTWYTITNINSNTSITLQSSAGTISAGASFVIDMTMQKDWVFLADPSTASTTRKLSLFLYDRLTSLFSWRGFITLTYPTINGNQTVRGMRAIYDTYYTGTVAVSVATVTGNNTTWSTDRISVGSRIGFGSTDPTQIATWYYINAVSSDTSITIQTGPTASGVGGTAANITVSSGTAYVIEDLRILTATTAVVIATGGLSIISGISYDDFNGSVGGTTIAVATTVDKTKALYSITDLDSLYSTGTVTVPTSTTVTGVGTVWAAATHLGCKIGFGSTTPSSITTWYTITAIGSGTSLTISSAATVSGGSSYVIIGGNGISAGITVDDRVSWTEQYCYIIEVQAATTPQVYKYNFRTDLTTLGGISSGRAVAPYVLTTGIQTVPGGGTVTQTNNGRIGTLTLGPGANVKSIYFVSGNRVCRAPVASIVSGSASWIADAMTEVPTGSSATYTATSLMTSVEIADQIDRLIITTTAGTTTLHHRAYVTQYDSSGSRPFDHMFLADTAQIDQSTADSNSVPHPSAQGLGFSVWSQGGLVYLVRTGTTSLTNTIYVVPLGADWAYADGTVKQRLITPSLATTNAVKLTRAYINDVGYLGDGGLTLPTEPLRLYYRTSGITDNAGTWTLIDQTGDISGAVAGNEVQFAVEFRLIGGFCIPNRVFNVCCIYEDNTTDSHYQPSVAQSSITSKIFAWRFSTAFGGTVPTLRVRLYDAVGGGLLLDDTTTSSASGVWMKSTDGGSNWITYNTSDISNTTTYIKYTPTSLGDDIKVRALLTQN